MKQLRTATFRDAQAIDSLIGALAPLPRDLLSWVNQADAHLALVDGTDVVGFGARMRHRAHPQRDLAAMFVLEGVEREFADALYYAIPAKRPLKIRLPADDYDGLDIARDHGFVERIRSATYRVAADAFAEGPHSYAVLPVEHATRELTDAFTLLYADSHRWDPPAIYTRRYVRQAMLNGAQHMAVVRDDDGAILGAGATHASDDASVAADIALVGALNQAHPDADDITGALLAHLCAFYAEDPAPLWFEVDSGEGTNAALARSVTHLAPAEDEVVILTTD
ncbi:MAG TPA: hypothetical protein VMZ22_11210 [Acidimicrobiales bacterium]|nr:hypothetical protein [Acidimicrobiales bacterium]